MYNVCLHAKLYKSRCEHTIMHALSETQFLNFLINLTKLYIFIAHLLITKHGFINLSEQNILLHFIYLSSSFVHF